MNHSWVSYLFSGAMALILSWTVTGCRLGNRVEDNKPGSDGLTGFYETAAPTAQACAEYTSATAPERGTQLKCVPLAFTDVPTGTQSTLNQIIRDPVIFQLKKQSTDSAYIYSPYSTETNPSNFLVSFDKDLKVTLPAKQQTFSFNSTCNDVQTFSQGTGQLTLAKAQYTKTYGSTSVKLSGNLTMDVSYGDAFQGDCVSALQYLAGCLKDSASCTSPDDLTLGQELFSFYLEKQVFTIDDLPTVKSVSTHILY